MYSMAAWGGRGVLPSGLAGSKLSMQLEHMGRIRLRSYACQSGLRNRLLDGLVVSVADGCARLLCRGVSPSSRSICALACEKSKRGLCLLGRPLWVPGMDRRFLLDRRRRCFSR